MELDAFVLGNWDFSFGKDQLLNLVRELPFPAVACNVVDLNNEYLLRPFIIKKINEVNVGIIGTTYPFVDETMPDSFSKGLKFSLGVAEVQRCVDLLKEENVDLIILISHMGLPIDYKLASMIDGINIILSAHSLFTWMASWSSGCTG